MLQNIQYCLVIKRLWLWEHTAKLSSLGLINLLHNWISDREICWCAQDHPRRLTTGLGSCSRCTASGWSGRWWALDPKCSCGTDWPLSNQGLESAQEKKTMSGPDRHSVPPTRLSCRSEKKASVKTLMYICDYRIKDNGLYMKHSHEVHLYVVAIRFPFTGT